MKKLILVRHGHYDQEGHLTYNGREEVKTLTIKLRQYIDKKMSLIILSSPSDRTYETAQIIGEAFGANIVKNHILMTDVQTDSMNLPAAFNLIKSYENFDVVIIVSHFDYVADLPKYFALRELGVKLPSKEIEKGKAWMVDCIDKTLTLLD